MFCVFGRPVFFFGSLELQQTCTVWSPASPSSLCEDSLEDEVILEEDVLLVRFELTPMAASSQCDTFPEPCRF